MYLTNEQKEFILNNYMIMSATDIAKNMPNIKPYQITYYLRKQGITIKDTTTSYRTNFSENDIKYMIDNYKTLSYKEIGEHLGFTERQIRGKINNMGLTKNRNFNKNYFKEIDTPLKAYF